MVMMKLSKFIHWPSFVAAMAISGFGGYVTYEYTSLGFWAGFGLTAIAMFVNGWKATIEDKQPGGFNDPGTNKDERNKE